MRGELREIGVIEISGNRNVLLRRRELVADLVMKKRVEFRFRGVGRGHEFDNRPGQSPCHPR
ncbi:Uncharacterised protein [Mycobacteroides abscessus subsp. abscessus]|nr:Uncharacterised protein [Mycobacteroides abscessus subsp. abscessus]